MQRNCEWCGRQFSAVKVSARFCGDTCKHRNQRAPKSQANGQTNGNGKAAPQQVDGTVAAIIRRELEALGLDATVPGHLVLDLAQRIDSPNTSDSSRAPLAREVMKMRDQLLRTVVDENDPLEILQERRRAKRSQDPEAYAASMRKWDALPEHVRHPRPI
jgi:hypothetical protein